MHMQAESSPRHCTVSTTHQVGNGVCDRDCVATDACRPTRPGYVRPAFINKVVHDPRSCVVLVSHQGAPVGLGAFHLELRPSAANPSCYDALAVVVDLVLGAVGESSSCWLLAFTEWWAARIKRHIADDDGAFAVAFTPRVQLWGRLEAVASARNVYARRGWTVEATAGQRRGVMFKHFGYAERQSCGYSLATSATTAKLAWTVMDRSAALPKAM